MSGAPRRHPVSSNGRPAVRHGPNQGETPPGAARERAQQAAGAHAWRLCDEVDRTQQTLILLGGELEGAVAICHAVFDDRCRQQEHDTLERAERTLGQLSTAGPTHAD